MSSAGLGLLVSSPVGAPQRVSAAPTAIPADTIIVLTDVNVLHMTGLGDPVLPRQSVLIRSGLIETIASAEGFDVPDGAVRIEGDGTGYLMPGLTDAHVHLEGDAETWMPMFLANGVTTVFNLRGGETQLAMRERVRAGQVVGPTIYTSGPFVNLPHIATPADADRAVREHVSAGYDFLKIHGNLEQATFERLMESATAAGLAVIGHAPRNLPFEAVLDLEMPMVAHAEELIYTRFQDLTPTDVPEIARRTASAGVWLTPTLSTFRTIVRIWGDSTTMRPFFRQPEARYLTADLRTYWTTGNSYSGRSLDARPRLQRMYDFQLPLVSAMHEAGVNLLAGTDTPLPGMYPGWSTHDEIETLIEAGLDPSDALAAATRNPGRFIADHVSKAEVFGVVAEGARADFLLLSENPLENLGSLSDPVGVMVRGRWMDRAELQRRLDGITPG